MNAMSLRHGEVVVPRVGRSNDCHAVFDLERITQQRGTAGGSSAERPASVRNRGLNDIPGAPAPGVDKSIPRVAILAKLCGDASALSMRLAACSA